MGDASAGRTAPCATSHGGAETPTSPHAQPVWSRHLATVRRRGNAGGERGRVPPQCGRRLDVGGGADHRGRPRPSTCLCDRRRHRSRLPHRGDARGAGRHGRCCVAHDADRWQDAAFKALETVCGLSDSTSVTIARARRGEVEAILDRIGTLAGTPVVEAHGDLHVGHAALRRPVRGADFDGNPVLQAAERMLPIPAALDVAGMAQSFSHSATVARSTALDDAALAEVDTLVRSAFLTAYADRSPPRPRRFVRSGRAPPLPNTAGAARDHLCRISPAQMDAYVPDAALPALLAEGVPS